MDIMRNFSLTLQCRRCYITKSLNTYVKINTLSRSFLIFFLEQNYNGTHPLAKNCMLFDELHVKFGYHWKPYSYTALLSRERRSYSGDTTDDGAVRYEYCTPGQTTCCLHRRTYTEEQMSDLHHNLHPNVIFPPYFEINECRGECNISPAGKVLL